MWSLRPSRRAGHAVRTWSSPARAGRPSSAVRRPEQHAPHPPERVRHEPAGAVERGPGELGPDGAVGPGQVLAGAPRRRVQLAARDGPGEDAQPVPRRAPRAADEARRVGMLVAPLVALGGPLRLLQADRRGGRRERRRRRPHPRRRGRRRPRARPAAPPGARPAGGPAAAATAASPARARRAGPRPGRRRSRRSRSRAARRTAGRSRPRPRRQSRPRAERGQPTPGGTGGEAAGPAGSLRPSCPTASSRPPRWSSSPRSPPPPPPRPRRRRARAATASTTPPACCRSRTTPSRGRTGTPRPGCGSRSARSRRRATPTGWRSTRPTSTAWTASAPGSVILTKVPGLATPGALARTNPVGLARAGAPTPAGTRRCCSSTRAPGERQPIWVELDSNAAHARDRLLEIHPARNLPEGRRYVVVLRGLRTAAGRRIKARRRFAALRDGVVRTTRYDRIFRTLKKAEVRRGPGALPDLGLHRGQPPLAVGAHAPHPRRRLRPARRPRPRRRRRAGLVAALHARRGLAQRRRREVPRPLGQGARGDDRGPLLPRPARVRPGLALQPRPGRPARAAAGQRPRGALLLRRAAHGDRRTRPRGCRSTATACSAATARSSRTPTSRRWPRSTTSSSARRRGRACRTRTSPTPSACCRTSARCRRSPTGCSRACSTRSTSGG